ncbi:hypothetical protein HKX48_000454 [Thoreauomyces humboldtii]|nr:hypothetical protein HKX48_000454 [Thoreauomyces humboldtii]
MDPIPVSRAAFGAAHEQSSHAVAPESFSFDEAKITAADTAEKKEIILLQVSCGCVASTCARTKSSLYSYTFKHSVAIQPGTGLEQSYPEHNQAIAGISRTTLVEISHINRTKTVTTITSLFDTLSAVQTIVANKKLEDLTSRLSAIHCLGVLTEAHGGKLLSLFAETVTLLQKIYKNAKDAEVRYECLVALERSLKGAGKGANDTMSKELVKLAKAGMVDKLPLIRGASIELYRSLYEHAALTAPTKLEEFEVLLLAICKVLEGGNYSLRRSIATFVSAILALSQRPAVKKDKGKRSAKSDATDAAVIAEVNVLEVTEVLGVFCTLLLKASSREARVGILEAYATTLRRFGPTFIEANYPAIVTSILELSTHPKIVASHAEAIFLRESCGFLLRDTVGKMLSETGQISAIKELGNGWLKKWPAVLGTDIAPPDLALVCVLNELAALLIDLGPAAAGEEGVIVEPLLKLLGHPSRSVNLALAWCLRCLSAALPSHMPRLIGKLMGLVQKDLQHLQGEKPKYLVRFLGLGNVLAGLISAAPSRTLFVSYETMARIFGLCAQLLRNVSTSKDFLAINAQSRVAWTLMGSLMCLGPDFVRVHTSQLLLIWKSVFPKPAPKESSINRSEPEWEYLLMSRESALAALHSFMVHNPKELATSDVAKRITVCLNNTLTFMSNLPSLYYTGPPPPPGVQSPEIRFHQMENFLRKRLFMCFKALTPSSTFEMTYSQLLRASLEMFAPDPEKSLERFVLPNSPASSDKAGPGAPQQLAFTTTLLQGSVVKVADDLGAEDRGIARLMNKDSDVQMLENLLEHQTPGTMENDPHCLYLQNVTQHASQSGSTHASHTYELAYTRPAPSPIPFATIDAAIEVFALLLPLQNASVQESLLEQLITLAKNQNVGTKTQTSPRKRSVQLNILCAIIGALKYVMVKKGALASGKVAVAIRDLVEEYLVAPDPVFRTLACEALGRLTRIVGTATFVNPVIQNLVDQVVKNRDPDVRAGSALGLGYILSYVGGMAAAPQLKMVVGILHSLATDPHPLVHTWALHSLWLTIESAGLMYGPFVNSTLSVTVKLLMSDTHELSALAANEQARNGNVDVYPAIGRILYALVGVIGPELSMSTKIRELCFTLYEQLKAEDDPFVVVEAIRCIQHFILFAPKHVDIFTLIPFLQMQLAGNTNTSQSYLTRKAAVTCMYQLAQRSPALVLEAAGNNQLEEQLFALLDMETDATIRDEIRDILVNLLKHVAPQKPSRWLMLCKSILSKTGGSVGEPPAVDDLADMANTGGGGPEDDDDDGFNVDHSDAPTTRTATAAPAGLQTTTAANLSSGISARLVLLMLKPRWRTQVFALVCLRHVLPVIYVTDIKAHFDLGLARRLADDETATGAKRPDYLVFKLADLIRMAFSAATANVNDLRLEGLRLLQDVLEKFATATDPDFEEHALLEQYQAQIGAALTPAFAPDSGPDVLSLACHVSAVYIGSGINKEVATMSRILRLLTTLMEGYKDQGVMTNAEAAAAAVQTSPHAELLVRISALTAWAHLHTASFTQSYLIPVTRPNLPALAGLWVALLTDYARVKLEPEVLSAAAGEPGVRASMGSYLEATRNVVLPFYGTSWAPIMEALTSLQDTQPEVLSAALQPSNDLPASPTLTVPTNVSKPFYVLLGLCIEALAVASSQVSSAEEGQLSRLRSLARLCRHCDTVSGLGLEEPLFLEIMTLLSKLVQTEDAPVQTVVLGIVKQIMQDAPPGYLCDDVETGLERRWDSGGGSLDAIHQNDAGEDVAGPRAGPEHSRKARKLLKVIFDMFVYHVNGMSTSPSAAVTANRPLTPASSALLISALDVLTAFVTRPELLKVAAGDFVPTALFIYLAVLRWNLTTVDPKSPLPTDIAPSSVNTAMLRNALLAAILTASGCARFGYQPTNEERVSRAFGRLLLQMVALQSLKSMVLSPLTSASERYLRILVAQLVAWFEHAAQEVQRGMGRSSQIPVVEEAGRTMVLLYGAVPDVKKLGVLTLTLDSLLSLLSTTTTSTQGIPDLPTFLDATHRNLHLFAAKTLLQVAGAQPAVFRDIIQRLEPSRLGVLQRGLKTIAEVGNVPSASSSSQQNSPTRTHASGFGDFPAVATPPKIELRSFAQF